MTNWNIKPGATFLPFGALLLLVQALPAQVSRPVVDAVVSAPAATTSLPDHKIVPNDLLSISVFDEPQVSRPQVRVGVDGTIAMPMLTNRLHVEGLLPRELEAEIARELVDEQILVHPLVAVAIMEYAVRQISVVGDVRIPGQFNITAPITLLEALAKAGWTNAEAGPDLLFSKSTSDPPRKINILQLQNTDPTLNVTLTGGEVVSVPDAPKVWVTGNVAHPQAVPVKNPSDATVLKVVASVEGLTQYYNKTAYIYRPDGTGKRQEIAVPLKDIMHRKAQDVQLYVDDILLIPDDNGTKRRALLQALQSLGGAATTTAVLAGLHP
jgi:polysaccharide export outer membrane protein